MVLVSFCHVKYLTFYNSDPGDLPHSVKHDLHKHRAPLQLCHLAQQITLLKSQFTVSAICIHLLSESGDQG